MPTWNSFAVFYAGIFPIGAGLLYWPPVICAFEWFPKQKGLVSGLIIGAYGTGAFVFSFIIKALLNPENMIETHNKHGQNYYPVYICKRVPWMFRYTWCMYAGLLIIGWMLVSRPSLKVKQKGYGMEERVSKHTIEYIKLDDAIDNNRFWHLFIMLFNGTFFGIYA